MIKCAGCWQKEDECICGLFGAAPVQDSFLVLVELPHDIPITPKSTARMLHDAKVLEKNQRLKNLEDMDKKNDG